MRRGTFDHVLVPKGSPGIDIRNRSCTSNTNIKAVSLDSKEYHDDNPGDFPNPFGHNLTHLCTTVLNEDNRAIIGLVHGRFMVEGSTLSHCAVAPSESGNILAFGTKQAGEYGRTVKLTYQALSSVERREKERRLMKSERPHVERQWHATDYDSPDGLRM